MAWTTRKTQVPPDHNDFGSSEFRMWAAVVTRLFDAQCQTQIDNTINYDANDVQVKSAVVHAGARAGVCWSSRRCTAPGLPITMNPAAPLPAALEALKALSREQVLEQMQKHRAWWDRLLAQILRPAGGRAGTSSEPTTARCTCWAVAPAWASTRPAATGSPSTTTSPGAATTTGTTTTRRSTMGRTPPTASSSRSPTTARCSRRTSSARAGQSGQAPGTFFYMATAPGHLNEPITLDQKTHAVEASLNLILRYTDVRPGLGAMYPFLKDVAAFWDFALERDKETRPNGAHRYVVKDSTDGRPAGRSLQLHHGPGVRATVLTGHARSDRGPESRRSRHRLSVTDSPAGGISS